MYSYEYSYSGGEGGGIVAIITLLIELAIIVFSLVVQWKLFVKMDMPGWYSLIPVFNAYKLFEAVFGQGAYCFLCLVPLLNIYVMIKFYIGLAQKFGKDVGFGIGLLLLSIVFMAILAFGDAEYDDEVEVSLF